MEKKKEKAKQNRTLSLEKAEVNGLKECIVFSNKSLKNNNIEDSICCGDFFDYIDTIPDNSFDLIIVDPPYNLSRDFHGKKFSAMKTEEYENYLHSWFGKVCDKLKNDGSLYMCGDWKCSSSMQRIIEERLTILNRITWQREKGRGAKANWKNGMEDIWFAVKDVHNYHFNIDAVKLKRRVIAPYKDNGIPKDWTDTEDGKFRITHPSNFWDDISIPFWSMPENTDHPTQKPEKLIAKLILASSAEGDIVFDPFMGSGTTAVVAKKLGRHYFGIEINEEYCLWAAKRLQQADNNKCIQGYADGVFWERNTANALHKHENI